MLGILSIITIVFAAAFIPVAMGGNNAAIALPFSVISLGIFVFMHGTARLGLGNLLLLVFIGMAISLFYEAMSIATGFPYSSYYYTDAIVGPKLLGFPIIVMTAYGVAAYTFWAVAEAVSGKFNRKLEGANIVIVPLVAGCLFTSLDLAMDPIMSTINGAYIWSDRGSYFGVPLMNFAGWYLATYTIFQIFAIFVYYGRNYDSPAIVNTKTYWYQPVIMYASPFLSLTACMIVNENREIRIASGQSFVTGDIYESMVIVGFAAIVVPAIIAVASIYNSRELSNEQ